MPVLASQLGVLFSLFWGFLVTGVLGFGGGPGSLGIIQAQVVDTYHWMTPQQFSETLAVANALPGPVATKLSGYIGFRVAGVAGLIAGLLGSVLPSLLMMLIGFALIQRYRSNPIVGGAIKGVQPIVGALLLMLVWQITPHALTPALGWFVAFGVAAVVALALGAPAVLVVVGSMVLGALLIRPGH